MQLRTIQVRGGGIYVPVAERIRWFRSEHPDWSITTDIMQMDENGVLFRATVTNSQGAVVATGHAYESIAPNYIEIAETSAIGRALGVAGYGTACALDEDESNERLADAPVENGRVRTSERILCTDCSRPLTQGQRQLSEQRYGRPLCPACQHNAREAAEAR